MKKSWYAVITSEVLYDKNLTAQQKILVAVVNNLRNDTGYCFASNKYLSEIISVSVRTIQREITTLEDAGYFNRVLELEPSGEVKHRFLTVNESNITPMSNLTPPYDKSVAVYNKDNNNKYNNNICPSEFDELLKFINKTLEKKFRVISNGTKRKYESRIKEGYKLQDIKDAIVGASRTKFHMDCKYKYLTPEFFSRADKIDMYMVNGKELTPKEKMLAKHNYKPMGA